MSKKYWYWQIIFRQLYLAILNQGVPIEKPTLILSTIAYRNPLDNLDYSNYPTIRNKYLTTIDLFLTTHFFNYSIISRCVAKLLIQRITCLNNRRFTNEKKQKSRKRERERGERK